MYRFYGPVNFIIPYDERTLVLVVILVFFSHSNQHFQDRPLRETFIEDSLIENNKTNRYIGVPFSMSFI